MCRFNNSTHRQKQLDFAVLLFVITATISSVILLGLELSGEKAGLNIPTISQIQNKYTMPSIVSAMKGSMYKEVTDDSDIDTVHNWIKEGLKRGNSMMMHGKSFKMIVRIVIVKPLK